MVCFNWKFMWIEEYKSVIYVTNNQRIFRQEMLSNCIWTTDIFFSMARQPYMGLGLLVSSRFHGHTHLRHTTVGRTPLDE
jgi:hypothetical protein